MEYKHLSLEDRVEIATGLKVKPGIDSQFNACMYRNGCRETAAEVEALRKDAERYRWLRNRLPGSAYRIAGVIYSEGGAGVDAAIDKAMTA